jgi:hypothetical protein
LPLGTGVETLRFSFETRKKRSRKATLLIKRDNANFVLSYSSSEGKETALSPAPGDDYA